jgi:hypothetical protein
MARRRSEIPGNANGFVEFAYRSRRTEKKRAGDFLKKALTPALSHPSAFATLRRDLVSRVEAEGEDGPMGEGEVDPALRGKLCRGIYVRRSDAPRS